MAAPAFIDFDDQGVRLARASSHPLRREIMARLLASDAPLCATAIGTEMYGQGFDNGKGSKVLHHLVALEKFGFTEFSTHGEASEVGQADEVLPGVRRG